MLAAFADPTFQFLLKKAQQSAALSDKEEDYELLSEFNLRISQLTNMFLRTLYLRKRDTSELEKLKNNQSREAMSELLDNGKISHKEFYEAGNVINITNIADSKYKCDLKPEENYDFDWFMRFFDAVGNISNKELQELWAKVLKEEVQTLGSCSLRTLDMIRNMSVSEARMFEKLACFVVRSGNMYFIYPTGFYDQDYDDCRKIIQELGINYADWIMPMFEAGVMTGENQLASHLALGDTIQLENDAIIAVISNQSENIILFEEEIYELTKSGIELYNIVHSSETFQVEEDYFISCLRYIKENHPEIEIILFKIEDMKAYDGEEYPLL